MVRLISELLELIKDWITSERDIPAEYCHWHILLLPHSLIQLIDESN